MISHGRSLLSEVLVAASLTKTLSRSGTLFLPGPTAGESLPPLSDSILLRVLRSDSLQPSKKLDFFQWFRANSASPPSAASYSLILRTLTLSGFSSEALSLLRHAGTAPARPALLALLRSFSRSGDFSAAIETLEAMEALGVALDSRAYGPVITALVRKSRLPLAVSLLFKVLHDCPDPPGPAACHELLVALAKSDTREDFKRVFDAIRAKEGFRTDVYIYNTGIEAFGRWGDLGACMKLFEEMKGSGSVTAGPNLFTYNTLLRVLCFLGKVSDAVRVFEELKESGHRPDESTYRILLHGCSKSSRIDEALRVFDEMEENGFSPSTVAYNALLDGLFKARRLADACRLFEKMTWRGVRASAWTHNIVIDGLFKNGRVEAGYTLFLGLKSGDEKGRCVDGVTYSIVVLRLVKEGLIPMALKLVEEMEGKGFAVDLVTITSLVVGLYRRGQWDRIDKLMKHVRDGNLLTKVLRWKFDMEALMKAPQSKAKDYTPMFPSKGELSEIMSLIQSAETAIRKEQQEKEQEEEEDKTHADEDVWSSSHHMDKLADRILSSDPSSPPTHRFTLAKGKRVGDGSFDVDMVNTFLSILLAKGKLSRACKLFEIFSDMGAEPGTYTYNSMMTSFVKRGYFDEAWNVLDAMGEKLCPSDIATYNLIIQGLGKLGRADLASAVLERLVEERGGFLDLVMYNTLINALGKDGRCGEAARLFEQMRSSGIEPDVVTYNTLIEVHAKAGLLNEAHGFLKMMVDEGCFPNRVTDTILDFLVNEIEQQKSQRAQNKDDKS